MVIEKVRKDCKPYLREMRGAKNFLYRGTGKPIKVISKFKPRTDRKPLDTSTIVHEVLDNAFKKKFGWFARSEGVFTTSNQMPGYGKSTIFFPIGRYKYVWSPDIRDLFLELNSMSPGTEFLGKIRQSSSSTFEELFYGGELFTTYMEKFGNTDEEIIKNMKIRAMKEAESIMDKYTDKNLKKAGNSDRTREVAFKCNEYYVVDIAEIGGLSAADKMERELL